MTKVGFLFVVFLINLWSLGYWLGSPDVPASIPLGVVMVSVLVLSLFHPHMNYDEVQS